MNQPSLDFHQFTWLFFMLPFVLIAMVVVFIPYWFIFKKAGFTPWLSLLMFVPLGNIIMLYVLAFADWKVVPARNVLTTGNPTTPPRV